MATLLRRDIVFLTKIYTCVLTWSGAGYSYDGYYNGGLYWARCFSLQLSTKKREPKKHFFTEYKKHVVGERIGNVG